MINEKKPKKERADKYEKKLKIEGGLDDVLKISTEKTSDKNIKS